MIVTPVKTPIITPRADLLTTIKEAIVSIPEKSVLAVSSKVVAISEGRVVPLEKANKQALIKQESEYYTDPHSSKYNLMLTINHDHLVVNAGVDESNADGNYVLWPADPQESANQIWRFLRQSYQLDEIGVVLTDSRTFPLEWGVIGMAVSHCGFVSPNDVRGQKDLFGREMKMEQINVAHQLASAAVFEMGEVAEQQPLCLLTNLYQVKFQDHPPTPSEIAANKISLDDDLYAPLLQHAGWKKGGNGQS